MDGLYVVYDAVLLRCCLGMVLLLESLHSLHYSWRNHARAVVSWKLATSCCCLLVPMVRMGLRACEHRVSVKYHPTHFVPRFTVPPSCTFTWCSFEMLE